MKATMSKDGWPRFDMRVTYRVGVMEMASYLSLYMISQDEFNVWDPDLDVLPAKLPKATILEYVKYAMTTTGVNYIDGWSDDLDYETAHALLEWATSVILRAFPELNRP